MGNIRDIKEIAKKCEACLDISQGGALTEIRLRVDALQDAPFFDAEHDSIYFPLLLEVLDHWQQEGKVSRLFRFYEREDVSRRLYQLGPGLLMWLFDQEGPSDIRYSPLWHYGWALLRINLHGNMALSVGGELLELNQAAALLTYGEGSSTDKNVGRPELETGVSLLFDPQWLSDKLGDHDNQLADLLDEGRGTADSVTQLMRIDGRLVDLAHQLLDLTADDSLYFLEVEALTTNLLVQSLKLLRAQTSEGEVTHKLGEADIDKLTSVKELLESDYSNQYSLAELSRQVGLNRRKLTEGFKGLFGATVNEYLLRERMINAAKMLRQGASATEVAHRVGYKEQSSFTRAFKRHYGILPRDFCD